MHGTKEKIFMNLAFFFCLIFTINKNCFGIEHYNLKFLFEMKSGTNQYELYYVGEPWKPKPGEKPGVYPSGPSIVVDNSDNFYFLNRLRNIQKFNSKGELIKEIKGSGKFTKPVRMELDCWDNLYVVFQNDTNVVTYFEYLVMKFDSSGKVLNFIGYEGGNKPFKLVSLHVNINGSLFLYTAEKGGKGLQRFDDKGNFTGFVDFPLETEEGMDGNIYLVDKSVKRFTSFDGSLKKIRGIKPVAEKEIFSKVKGKFLGFDVDNNLCFHFGRIRETIDLPKYRLLACNPSGRVEYFLYDFSSDKCDTLRREGTFKKDGKYQSWYLLRNFNNDIYEVHIYFNDPPNVTPEDHVKFYKWEKIEEN